MAKVTPLVLKLGQLQQLQAGDTEFTVSPNATDAPQTIVVNSIIYLPAATLTVNRTITVPTGNAGDFFEVYNNEMGFVWSFAGSAVYLADGVTTVTALFGNLNYLVRFVSGKWRVLN